MRTQEAAGSAEGDALTLELGNDRLSLQAGMEILVYFDRGREFLQQSALVVPIELDELEGDRESETAEEATESWPSLGIELIGAPISAEQREVYRVRTSDMDISLAVEKETDWGMLDVSSTGFAYESQSEHKLGKILAVEIRYDGDKFEGPGSVQSVTNLRRGQMRYGLRAVDTALGPGKLVSGLGKLSLDAQRRMVHGGGTDPDTDGEG